MFKCNDCGCEFDDPMVTREHHGLEYGYEEICVCPACGSTDYEANKTCPICGEDYFGDNCEWCLADAKGVLMYEYEVIKKKYPRVRMSDFIDLYTEAIEQLYLDYKKGAVK